MNTQNKRSRAGRREASTAGQMVKPVGQGLRVYRKRLGYSVTELARRAGPGVSVSTISRIEHGHIKKPSTEIVEALARALGVTPMHLSTLGLYYSPAEEPDDEVRQLLLTKTVFTDYLPPEPSSGLYFTEVDIGLSEGIRRLEVLPPYVPEDFGLASVTPIAEQPHIILAASRSVDPFSRYARDPEDPFRFQRALQGVIARGWNVAILVPPTSSAKWLLRLARETFPLLRGSEGYQIYKAPRDSALAALTQDLPPDVLFIPGRAAIAFYGPGHPSPTRVEIHPAVPEGVEIPEDRLQALKDIAGTPFAMYKKALTADLRRATPLLQIIPRLSAVHSQKITDVQSLPTDRYLVENGISVSLVPWSIQKKQRNFLLRMGAISPYYAVRVMEARKQRHEDFLANLEAGARGEAGAYDVYDLCPRAAITDFIEKGILSFGDSFTLAGARVDYEPDKGTVLESIIEFLEKYPTYHLGLMDLPREGLTGYCFMKAGHRVHFDAWTLESAGRQQLDVQIRDPQIVEFFTKWVRRTWAELDFEGRDRASVIDWLWKQRSRVP